MKKFLVLFSLILFCFCVSSAQKITTKKSLDLPKNLDTYLKKYPYPSDFIKHTPNLKKRLMALLGKKYSLFDDNLNLQTPIEKEDNLLIATGSMKYSQGYEESMYIIDLNTMKIHIGLISKEFKEEYKIYSEDKENIPRQIQEWIDLRAERRS